MAETSAFHDHGKLASQDVKEKHVTTEQPAVVATESRNSSTDGLVPTTKFQFLIIIFSLLLAVFCIALDNTIIVTAIPRITDAYRALGDVGWYVPFSRSAMFSWK
jgi:hypothetical protein